MAEHTHTFYVFSTAIAEAAIMVLCPCGQFGVIEFEDHTQEEWQRAFHAPSQPYRWHDTHRVTLKHDMGAARARDYLGDAALPEEDA